MGMIETVKSKLREYRRVLKITSKPDFEEFKMSAQITGLGILLIGLIGFLVFMIGNITLY